MATKERIHRLVDALPEEELKTAERMLEGLAALALSDPVARALALAPEDDEPVTEEEAAAIEEGERDVAEGRVVTADEVRARLGL